MSLPKKKPQRVLNIAEGVGLAASHGLASVLRLSQPAQDLDTSPAPANVGITDAGFLRILESLGAAKRTILANKALSDIGRRQRYDAIAAAAARDVFALGKPVVGALGKRVFDARESFGSSGGPFIGREAVTHFAGGRTTGFDDARGQLALASLKLMASHLVALTDKPNPAEEVQTILRDAASSGDLTVWIALDVMLPPTLRDKVLRAAVLFTNPTIVENMRRTLRVQLDPAGSAQIDALEELGKHVVSNLRSAIDACDKSGYRPEPDGERLEIQLARVLEPLSKQLRALGVGSIDLGPTAGAR